MAMTCRSRDTTGFPDQWSEVHGFILKTFFRTKVIVSNPPPTNSGAEWQDFRGRLRFWLEDSVGSVLKPSAVDALGGPVYTLPQGWTEIPAVPRATNRLPMPRPSVAVDVYVPANADGWLGDVQLSVQIPAAHVWDTYLGYRALDALPRGQWTKVEFPLPDSVVNAFSGDYPGALIKTFLNTGIDGVQIRGLRFSGDLPTARPPHAQINANNVRSNDFLSFENAADWANSSHTAETTFDATHGLRAMRLNMNGSSELESRLFSTSELPSIGSTLAVDVFVPSPRASQYWLGQVQAYLNCPSAGVWGQWLGQAELTDLFDGEWNTVRMPLPANAVGALSSNANDCSLRFTIDTQPSTASFLVDRVGFLD